MTEDTYFYDSNSVPYKELLEQNTEVIRNELWALFNQSNTDWTSAYPEYLSEKTTWNTFELFFFGIKHEANIQKCPQTFEIISQIPELITAQFSVLFPNSHILPHKGYSKMILRNHLPLIVPDGKQCALKIEDETHFWEKGKLVVFDDSFVHEAWNNSDEIRVVLMFDVAKPDCDYSAHEICKYKLENLTDENLLKIAPKEKWLSWFEKGYFE